MRSNYLVSLIMFLVGITLYFFSKPLSSGNIGLKIPFSLEKSSNLAITNKFFGKTLVFGGPLSGILCFLISLTPLDSQVNEPIFYNGINICIILILAFVTEVRLRFR